MEALRLVGNSFRSGKAFDAIFMDCIMPIMDGPTAAREILSIGYTGIIVGFTGGRSGVANCQICIFLESSPCNLNDIPASICSRSFSSLTQ